MNDQLDLFIVRSGLGGGATHEIIMLGVQGMRLRGGSFLENSSGNELDLLP